MNEKIITWWSGGITSAVTCKICIDLYGLENIRLIFIDTFNGIFDLFFSFFNKRIIVLDSRKKTIKQVKNAPK